jgi:hypothetical protein
MRRSSCCGALTGLLTLTTTAIALFCTSSKRKRPGHETVYECQVCNVSLCIEPCFRLFHSCQEYALAYKRWKTANQRFFPGNKVSSSETFQLLWCLNMSSGPNHYCYSIALH